MLILNFPLQGYRISDTEPQLSASKLSYYFDNYYIIKLFFFLRKIWSQKCSPRFRHSKKGLTNSLYYLTNLAKKTQTFPSFKVAQVQLQPLHWVFSWSPFPSISTHFQLHSSRPNCSWQREKPSTNFYDFSMQIFTSPFPLSFSILRGWLETWLGNYRSTKTTWISG